MKKTRITVSALLCLVIFLGMCAGLLSACGGKTLASIEVSTRPSKVVYAVNESLDLTGGVLTLKYSDDSTETKALDASGVAVTRPDMSSAGTKDVNVEYDGKTTSFQITVESSAEQKRTVTFNLNYTNAPAAGTSAVDSGQTVSPVTPQRSGYAFDGWFTEAACVNAYDFSSAVTADLQLYAKWTELFTVRIDLNYTGAGTVTPQSVKKGEKASVPSGITREGYTLTGWFKDAGCTEIYVFDNAVTSNITLYAKWVSDKAVTHNVTFDYNYDNAPANLVVKVEDGQTASSSAPARYGYAFGGWYTEAGCTTAYVFTTAVTSDITLYAKWTVDFYPVYFKYNIEGYTENYMVSEIEPGDALYRPVNPTVKDKLFMGWYSDADCTESYTFGSVLTGGLEIYAKWFNAYTFEAEYTDLGSRPAQGFSNNGEGEDMIGKDTSGAGASNGYFIASLYYNGAYIYFDIVSDRAVTDARLVLRLSSEFYDMSFTSGNFAVEVNGTDIPDYPEIDLSGAISISDGGETLKRPFTNHEITSSLNLKEGSNRIRLVVRNKNDHGGTMNADAPMIDCMSIYTSAVLTWTPKSPVVMQ